LRIEEAFQLLALLGAEPYEFFEEIFPLGGEARTRLALSTQGDQGQRATSRIRDLIHREAALRGDPPPTPRDFAARAGRLLRDALRRAHISQEEASRRLGLGPTALGQALRRTRRLSFAHLFGVLSLVDHSPGRFFEELFGPGEEEILPGLDWSSLLERLEPLMTAVYEQAGKSGGSHAPMGSKIAGTEAPMSSGAPEPPG
jgi:transcriptional regulator with XRE-family HTH domain